MCQIIPLYTLNLHSIIYQYYFNRAWKNGARTTGNPHLKIKIKKANGRKNVEMIIIDNIKIKQKNQ